VTYVSYEHKILVIIGVQMKSDVIIIGAGMSGLTAAITLARGGKRVVVLESNDKIGKKLLMTGNGRCNLSNVRMDQSHFHSNSKNLFKSVYTQMDLSSTRDFLSSLGIDWIEQDEGKLYPMSLQASSVVKALLMECQQLGIIIEYMSKVSRINILQGFVVEVHKSDKKYLSPQLIIATGGKSYSDTGSTGDGYTFAKRFGHRIIQPYPSIVQVKTDSPFNKSLKGFKCDCHGRLFEQEQLIRTEFGEVLWTEYGLSGPVILQLSTMIGDRIEKKGALRVSLDLMPNMTEQELLTYLIHRFKQLGHRTVEESLNGLIHFRMILPLLKCSNIVHTILAKDVTEQDLKRFVSTIKSFNQNITDLYLWNQAQVTKGGVDCREIHETTLESKLQKNLYFAGEVVDMDGDCGGYNLQWAMSSGYVAANSILEKK